MNGTLFSVTPDPATVTGRLPVPPGVGLRLGPCTIKTANQVVASWHRHSTPISQKVLCAVRAMHDDDTIGVAILGLPVSRVLDTGLNVEIRRVCVCEGAPRNACSLLYGAMCRAAAALGYVTAYTYTTADEHAASVKAAGFTLDGRRAAANWDSPGADVMPATTPKRTAFDGSAVSGGRRDLDPPAPYDSGHGDAHSHGA